MVKKESMHRINNYDNTRILVEIIVYHNIKKITITYNAIIDNKILNKVVNRLNSIKGTGDYEINQLNIYTKY